MVLDVIFAVCINQFERDLQIGFASHLQVRDIQAAEITTELFIFLQAGRDLHWSSPFAGVNQVPFQYGAWNYEERSLLTDLRYRSS